MTDAARTDPALPAESPSGDPRADRVAAAVKTWQRTLVDLGGRNTLLWYRDLPSGTLDLTTAHPGGVSMLLVRPPAPPPRVGRSRPGAGGLRGGAPTHPRDPVQGTRAARGARHRGRVHR